MNPGRFRYVWKAIVHTWENHKHCFESGCGRDTLYHWVRETPGYVVAKWEIRPALEIACSKGWVEKGKSCCGYTTFKLLR